MRIELDVSLAAGYRSPLQRTRVVTEGWVLTQAYCPACGCPLRKSPNNAPVLDFNCSGCSEAFELKSKKTAFAGKIVDGAYKKMLERLTGGDNPNFLFLGYSPTAFSVSNFFVVPKHFFTPAIIEKRRPLSPRAVRAGWTGCNILLGNVPQQGRLYYVKDGEVTPPRQLLDSWRKTLFLREQKVPAERGWIMDVMICLDRIGKAEFVLADVYAFADFLQGRHPDNRHVRDKIRQQLQLLRDKGYLEFKGRGRYRLAR